MTPTIADQDGDYADWLEIYNPDPAPHNLGGWYLTNKANNLTKWMIPPVVLTSRVPVLSCFARARITRTRPSRSLRISTCRVIPAATWRWSSLTARTVASAYTYPSSVSRHFLRRLPANERDGGAPDRLFC